MKGLKLSKKNYLILGVCFLILLILFIIISSTPTESRVIGTIKQATLNKELLTENEYKEIELIINDKNKLNPNDAFILGYVNSLDEDTFSVAMAYFETVIENKEKITADFALTFSYKFLAKQCILNGNLEKGLEYSHLALDSINPKEYNDYKNFINDIFRPILEVPEGRILIIDFLESMLRENITISDKNVEFYASRTLEEFYLLNGDYTQALEMSTRTVELADELSKHYFKGISLLNISKISYLLGDFDAARDIALTVSSITAEDAEWEDKLNLHQLLTLSKIELASKNYDLALDYIMQLDNHTSNINLEDRQDTDIMKHLTTADIMIKKNQLHEALEQLSLAKDIMDIDTIAYWPDKDIYYDLIYGHVEYALRNYESALYYFEQAKQLSAERQNIEGLENSLMQLVLTSNQLGNLEQSANYLSELNQSRKIERTQIHKDYYDYTLQKNLFNETEQYSHKVTYFSGILLCIILLTMLFIYKNNIRPLIVKKLIKRKVEDHLLHQRYLPYYQPIINPKTNQIMGYEALLRLKFKDKLIFPNVLIKELEDSNMMIPVSYWLLTQVIKDFEQINNAIESSNDFYISLNLSLEEIENNQVIDDFIKLLHQSNIERNRICLEITENMRLKNINQTIENINKLKEAGFIIAIDDFGVEYSNFNLIEQIPFDIVKIDKTFINNIESSEVNKELIHFCDNLFGKQGKTIIIEGVEESNQVEYIKNTNSDQFYIQGYFYSKPVDINQIIKFKL